MMLKHHLMLSSLLFLALYAAGKGLWFAGAAFAASFAIDADHLLAFFRERRKVPGYAELERWCKSIDRKGCIFFAFHNVWLVAVTALFMPQAAPVLLGILLHYAADAAYDVYRYKKSRSVFFMRRWFF